MYLFVLSMENLYKPYTKEFFYTFGEIPKNCRRRNDFNYKTKLPVIQPERYVKRQ